jgi:hypothetical protein
MTRRRLIFGLLLASAVLACFAGWLWIASRPRVSRERLEQVKEGMSREEVVQMLGEPVGKMVGGPLGSFEFESYDCWVCDDAKLELWVRFDDADRAIGVMVLENSPPTLTERIGRWLGL